MRNRKPTTKALVRLGDPKAQKVLDAAQAGDPSVLPTIRGWLETAPALLDSAGNIAAIAEKKWTERIAGKNLLVREAVAGKLATLKASLAGQAPSAIERLLVERVAACWLQLSFLDSIEAQNQGGQSFRRAEFDLKRQGSAQRRHLAAIRTLAEVRRLLAPNVQVNFAEQQVNFAVSPASD